MAYDERLTGRVRRHLATTDGTVTEGRMFGGDCFSIDGNLCCCVRLDGIFVRVGADARDAALREPHVRPMRMRGKASAAFVEIAPEAVTDDESLATWIDRAVAFTATLPSKNADATIVRRTRTPRRRI